MLFRTKSYSALFGWFTWRALSACLGIAALSGCGWHLQGSAHLPATLVKIRIDTQDAYSDFYRELRSQLVLAGAQLAVLGSTDGVTLPLAVVHVNADETGQRLTSVSARNRPEQYEVYYSVKYFVELSGTVVIPDQSMELTASYSYDSTAVLAKQREQSGIQQALARDLAAQVLRRLVMLEPRLQARPNIETGGKN